MVGRDVQQVVIEVEDQRPSTAANIGIQEIRSRRFDVGDGVALGEDDIGGAVQHRFGID